MGRVISSLAVIFAALFISACDNDDDASKTPEEPQTPEVTGFVAKGWNGHYVEAMALAYETFLEDDAMPVYVNVEGLNYNRGRYLAIGCMVLNKIVAEPDTWQDEEVDFIQVASPDNDANNTLDLDVMSLDEFLVVVDKIYDYAETNNIFPNYCTVDADHVDADGSTYSTKMTINAISVVFARIFSYYVENASLPESFSTWSSDFLRATSNCEVGNATVISTMETATAGMTTDYDKAKAIFDYARDEWDWEDYSNTRKGAVGTINAGGGNCCDLSHAIIAMSRAAGIPARYRHAQCQFSSSVIGHVVAELYVDGVWWLCDASNNSNTFGNHESWTYMSTFNGRYNSLPF